MLQRCLHRSTRTLGVHAAELRVPQSQRFINIQPRTLPTCQYRGLSATTWRRAEAEAKAESASATEPSEAKDGQETVKDDPAQKELESKKREVVDVTVRETLFTPRNLD